MDIQTILAGLSGVFSFVAYLPYIFAILKPGSTVRPNRATWFVWWLVDIIGAAALIAAREYQAVPMFIAWTFGSSIVLILSVKRGEGGFSKTDLTCIAIALVGGVLWRISGNPTLAIAFQMASAASGTIPTIQKAWRDPASEDKLTWQLFAIGGLCGILAIKNLTFAAVAPPINIFTLQVLILIPLLLAPRRTANA